MRAFAADDSEELAKDLSNPVAPIINVPLQYTYDHDIGPNDGHRSNLKIQPVIPMPINDEWRVISRTILPVTDQSGIVSGDSTFGLGDITQSFFFAPAKKSGGTIFGLGPAILIPTATDDALGGGKWGLGPTAVLVQESGPWTFAFLTNQIWSVAGDGGRADSSNLLLQPSINYHTKDAWTYGLQTEFNYDWNAGQASAPLTGTVSKLVKFGMQPISFSGGLGYWVKTSDSSPEGWRARLGLTFVLQE